MVALAGPLATGSAAAAAAVLTFGPAPAGAPVAVGNVLTAPLAAATVATFTTAPGGAGVGTTCTVSGLTGQVLANPAVPGVAQVKIVNQTFNTCTSSIPGVGAVTSVVVNNLPYMGMFSDAGGLPVTIIPTGPPIQITINETVGGLPVACVWQLNAGAYHGNYVNGGGKITLINQQIHIVAGPGGPCAAAAQFVNVTYAPFVDSSMPAPNLVWVN